MKIRNKALLSGLISVAVLSLTACGGGSGEKDPVPEDKTAPVITLTGGNALIIIEEGDTYIEKSATATDNVDASVDVITSGHFDNEKAGRYTKTYTATDLAGNSSTLTQKITVIRQPSFNPFDGEWSIACEKTDNAELNALNITYLAKDFIIVGRDAKFRAKGFNTTDCSGEPLINGAAFANMAYSGKVVSSSGHTGENIDISLVKAHYRIVNKDWVKITDKTKMNDFASRIGMPTHDMLAKETRNGDDILLHGSLSTDNNGSSNEKRPVEFDVTNVFYK